MDRQIPRSIQYSDLRPEVIENQVKLIRFTPQTNIQNQVPNDVVRFQLIGNGFLDPYSTYIHMVVDFGKESENFLPYSSEATTPGAIKLRQYWENAKLQAQRGSEHGWETSHLSHAAISGEVGCRLGSGILSFEDIIYTPAVDGVLNSQLSYVATKSFSLLDKLAAATTRDEYAAQLVVIREVLAGVNGKTMPATTQSTVNLTTNLTFKDVGITDYFGYNLASTGNAGGITNVSVNVQPSELATTAGIPLPGAEFKMLDRSAHSFINRLVIRSQGTEIERIEQYDVVAAMLNDLIYSNEQAQFHSFEGFGGAPYIQNDKYSSFVQINRTTMAHSVQGPRGRVGERIWGWAFAAVDEAECDYTHHAEHNFDLTSQTTEKTRVGLQVLSDSVSLIARTLTQPSLCLEQLLNAFGPGLNGTSSLGGVTVTDVSNRVFFSRSQIPAGVASNAFSRGELGDNTNAMIAKLVLGTDTAVNAGRFRRNTFENIFHRNQYHPLAQFVNKYSADKYTDVLSLSLIESFTDCNVGFFRAGNYRMIPLGQQIYEFVIPIYSGLIGVLMPEKKLVPMSLMPLEVDFTLNPHALITAHSSGYGGKLTRLYTMRKMEVYSHVVFFEQEVHRSMESIVAEHGLFIHMNTFYMAPVTLHATDDVTNNIAINLHFKNINSIHMVNMYTKYLTSPTVRKLHFCSHNIRNFQIRNGSDLIPSEPLSIQPSTSAVEVEHSIQSGRMSRIFIELLKSYNKMHDPLCDTALDMGLSYQQDNYADTSSSQAQDYDIKGNQLFSQNARLSDVYIQRALAIATKTIPDQEKLPAELVIDDYDLSHTYQQTLSPFVNLDYEQARGFLRALRAGGIAQVQGISGVSARGAWGVNPNHISIRPNIFFIPNQGKATLENSGVEIYGLSLRLLSDKISRFSAMVGRCQYAISLEGINLGSNAQLLCGKRGMIPFDIMVQGTKSDKESSMSLVFAKCDFIVYIRPDLVVTVLGR